MQQLEIDKTQHMLIVAPHPDDECIGAGGILALFPGICDVLVLSDGRQGQGDVPPEREKVIRREEFVREMTYLGVRRYFFREFEDGTLMRHLDGLDDFELYAYDKVFVTGTQDGHPDHTAAANCVMRALKRQKNIKTQLFFYEVHTPIQNPTHYLDITDSMKRKKKLISFHQSQLSVVPYADMAEHLAVYRGMQNRMPDRRLEVYRHVSVGEYDTAQVSEGEVRLQKQTVFYWTYTRWVEKLIGGGRFAPLLSARGIQSVAVYGYAEMGKLLTRELLQEGVDVLYVMDRKAHGSEQEAPPVCYPDKNLAKPDGVIVTAVFDYDAIREELEKMGFRKILSLRTLLEE
ncbi:MAG: PIG-L family deacetylase [Roseburia sp.]|nr:PIG-L family deacetylase [Roseburia sp.]